MEATQSTVFDRWIFIDNSSTDGEPCFSLGANQSATVGRSSSNDWILEIQGVSRQHAKLTASAEGIEVEDLGSSNGSFVNGDKVTKATLKDGDRLSFHDFCVSIVGVEDPADSPPTDATTIQPVAGSSGTQIIQVVHGYLVGTSEPILDQRFDLRGTRLRIGRTEENQITIPHPSVSTHHADLVYLHGMWQLKDHNSTNGSFIDGEKIQQSVIKPGQQIGIGQVTIAYELASKKAEVPLAATVPAMPAIDPAMLQQHSGSALSLKTQIPMHLAVVAVVLTLVLVVAFVQRDSLFDIVDTVTVSTDLKPLELNERWQGVKIPSDRFGGTLALADVNGDKTIDVLVADGQGYVTGFSGVDGSELYASKFKKNIYAPPVVGNLDADPDLELVVADYGGRVHQINARGDVDWTSPASMELGEITHRPLLVDSNRDGLLDIIVATSDKGLAALDPSTNGRMIWSNRGLIDGRVSTMPMIADFDNDGIPDFVTTTDRGQVLVTRLDDGVPRALWQLQTAPIQIVNPTLIRGSKGIAVAVATQQQELLALDGLTGSLQWQIPLGGEGLAALHSVDTNADQQDDVLVTLYDGTTSAYSGRDGSALWSASLGVEVQASAAKVDINADQIADLLISDTRGQLHILSGADGAELLSGYEVENADSFSSSPVIGDIDSDLELNVIVISQNGVIHNIAINRHSERGGTQWPGYMADEFHGVFVQ